MARSILITSGKGGVGKSTITYFLGRTLVAHGAKVLLLDADPGLRNLDILMGLEGIFRLDFYDVYKGRGTIKDAIITDEFGLDLLVLYSSITATLLPRDIVFRVLSLLSSKYDFILIDSPAGLENGFLTAASYLKEAIVVVHNEPTSLRDATQIITILEKFEYQEISYVLNRVPKKASLNLERISDKLLIKNLGIISEHELKPHELKSFMWNRKLYQEIENMCCKIDHYQPKRLVKRLFKKIKA